MQKYLTLMVMALMVTGCDSASRPQAKTGDQNVPQQAKKVDPDKDLLPYDQKVAKEAAAVVKHSDKKQEKVDPHKDLF